MADKPALGPLVFGFDIGIASVGWAVLSPTRIVDLGVRAFDKAETAKEGESLNLQRRTARLLRRRLWRRAWRLTKLSRLLKRHGLIDTVEQLKSQPNFTDSTWALRVAALDRQLTPIEWARVLYHLCKHRGFHWVSKAEERAAESDAKGEGGRVKAGLSQTKKLMDEKNYRTAAEMVLAEFPDAQRNKRGDYGKALSRVLLDDELRKLFEAQRALGNPHVSTELEAAIRGSDNKRGGLFWSQKPALAGADLLKMLGHCTFEKQEFRAPKASFTAERHVWLTKLNNLRVIVDGDSRPLTAEERAHALTLPYQSGEKFTYKTLRKALTKIGMLPDSFRFGGLAYPSAKQKDEDKAKDPEDQTLVKLPAWHELRLALNKAGLRSEWEQLSTAALEGSPDALDSIAWVLSVYKDDNEVQPELIKLGLPGGSALIDTLLGIRFDKFHALSLKALRRIVPHMEQGMRYDEAVAQISEYGHHSQRFVAGAGTHQFLPPFYSGRDKDGRMKFREDLDVPRNPVVLRSLNQARKVLNALIKEYGPPASVHIEMARDLSRPLDERRDIEKLQKEYRDRNDAAREQFSTDYGRRPNGAEFEKWLLYREQHGKCAYSLEPLDLERVINDPSYVQVDHALPYSRSYDDSKNNKVLALTKINQDKGNRTPYEFLDGASDSERWRHFSAWVETNKSYRQAKRSRLLRKNFGEDEASSFRDRNLNDTRYICKFFKNYIEQHLQLADGSEHKRCVVLNGQLTSFLRARWGLTKVREESDRHHALDAAVVAACSHSMVKRLADYARRKELEHLREGFADPETGEIINPTAHQRLAEHFPDPWPHFRHELTLRLKTDDIATLRDEMYRLGTYSSEALDSLRSLFVSRAPQRRNGGAVHKDTVYAKAKIGHRITVFDKKSQTDRSATETERQSICVQKIGVLDRDAKGNYKFSLESLERILDPQRNERTIHSLRLWLTTRDARDKSAKAIEMSWGRGNSLREPTLEEKKTIEQLRGLPRKPCSADPIDGPFTGPIIRSIKLNIGKTSGIGIRQGIAMNDTMLRVDVFQNTKDRKYHLVPVYVHHRVSGLPNRAIVQKKDEANWTLIDETFQFLFSMHPNDLVRIEQRGNPVLLGYFRSCHSGAETISIALHDRAKFGMRTVSLAAYQRNPAGDIGSDKLGLIENLGVKTALKLEKLHVNVLGHVYPAPPEQRRGLA